VSTLILYVILEFDDIIPTIIELDTLSFRFHAFIVHTHTVLFRSINGPNRGQTVPEVPESRKGRSPSSRLNRQYFTPYTLLRRTVIDQSLRWRFRVENSCVSDVEENSEALNNPTETGDHMP